MGKAWIQEKIHALCQNNRAEMAANCTRLACCCLRCLFSKSWSVEIVGHFLESMGGVVNLSVSISLLLFGLWHFHLSKFSLKCPLANQSFPCFRPELLQRFSMKSGSWSAPFLWRALINSTEGKSLPLNENLLRGVITHICYLLNTYTEDPF